MTWCSSGSWRLHTSAALETQSWTRVWANKRWIALCAHFPGVSCPTICGSAAVAREACAKRTRTRRVPRIGPRKQSNEFCSTKKSLNWRKHIPQLCFAHGNSRVWATPGVRRHGRNHRRRRRRQRAVGGEPNTEVKVDASKLFGNRPLAQADDAVCSLPRCTQGTTELTFHARSTCREQHKAKHQQSTCLLTRCTMSCRGERWFLQAAQVQPENGFAKLLSIPAHRACRRSGWAVQRVRLEGVERHKRSTSKFF